MSSLGVAAPESKPVILVVDDEPFNIEILLEYLSDFDCEIETACDGREAWDKLEADPGRYDVIILDRMMPRMNGMEVLARVKAHQVLQSAPVILQTALAGKHEIVEGLQAGAYYYLTKPFEEAMLHSVLSTALADRRRYREMQEQSDVVGRTFGLMVNGSFRFRSLGAARDLANVLASAFPDPRRAIIGLAELLINAVEHGNLAISYAEKSTLREDNAWEQEVDRRLEDPRFSDRLVEVEYRREADRVSVVIRDQGEGFDWEQYMEIDPDRAFDTHGRGIAMSRMVSFDVMEYRGQGNEVEVAVLIGA